MFKKASENRQKTREYSEKTYTMQNACFTFDTLCMMHYSLGNNNSKEENIMPTYKFQVCNSRYGAPMGRASYNKPPTKPRTVRLFCVPLDSGGYDNGWAYWGIGYPLWCAMAAEDLTGLEQYRDFVRAPSRRQAMKALGLTIRQLISKKDI